MSTTTELRGKFEKFVDEQQIAFGLASVVQDSDGTPITDLHGDVLEPHSLEKAVYAFMQDSRDSDVMHIERGIGEVIESIFITPDKIEAIGKALGVDMPSEVPIAWWVGVKVHNSDVWKAVKSGALQMFSITGSGERTELIDD